MSMHVSGPACFYASSQDGGVRFGKKWLPIYVIRMRG